MKLKKEKIRFLQHLLYALGELLINYQFIIHNSQFTIINSQFTIIWFCPAIHNDEKLLE